MMKHVAMDELAAALPGSIGVNKRSNCEISFAQADRIFIPLLAYKRKGNVALCMPRNRSPAL